MASYGNLLINEDKCIGCLRCVRACPTEALRLKNRKPIIFEERCICCGECIKVCPAHARAIVSASTSYKDFEHFSYRVALPSPTLYSQFGFSVSPNKILLALKELPFFNEVFDVGKYCELFSFALRRYLEEHKENRPLISCVCPVIVKLIQIKFPSLVDHLLPFKPPREIAAKDIKDELCERLEIEKEKIGVIYIAPCAAKVGIYLSGKNKESDIDGAMSIADIYGYLLSSMRGVEENEFLLHSSGLGISWSITGGDIIALDIENALFVDGMRNVMEVLEDIENGRLDGIDYIDMRVCPGGCVGGAFTVDYHYIAKAKVLRFIKDFGVRREIKEEVDKFLSIVVEEVKEPKKVSLSLDADPELAIEKLNRLEKIYRELPGLDCALCGAPSCRAFAEDVVMGRAKKSDCIFYKAGKDGDAKTDKDS